MAFKPLIIFSLQMYDNCLTTVAHSAAKLKPASNTVASVDVACDSIKKTFQCGEHILPEWNKSGNKTNNCRAKGCNQ